MKILQAIATSAAETLDGHKGEGLVYCSEDLPVEIQKEARHIGYSPDAGGHAIYSLKKIDASAKKWLMMNHTVPTVDYTGRSSYVSHTIVIDEQLLLNHFQEGAFIPSVFDFMRRFEWRSCWDEAPKSLNHSEDLDASSENAFQPDLFDANNPLDPSPLLAFEYPDGANPKPKRAIWHFDGKSAEEILDEFHQAWLCLDPWQGTRKYGDFLNEPKVSLLDSWLVPFTTNLRGGTSEDYQWIVASPDCPSIPGVASIEPSRWTAETPDSIKDRIGGPLGDMLVERCVQGPETWATKQLEEKIAALKREYSESVKKSNTDLGDRVAQVLAVMEAEVTQEKGKVNDAGEWWLFDKEVDLNNWLQQLQRLKKEAQEKSVSQLDSFRQNANPIIHLLRHISKNRCEEEYKEMPLCFSSEWANFQKLKIQYQETRRVTRLLELAWEAQKKSNDSDKKCDHLESQIAILQGDQGDLKGKLNSSHNENRILHQEIADLKTRVPNPKKRKQMGWEMYSLISVSVIALGLAAHIGINYNKTNRNGPTPDPKSTYKEEKNMTILGGENTNQKRKIDEQEKK